MQLSERQWAILGGAALVAGFVEWKWGAVAAVEIAGGYVSNVFARGSVLSSSTLVAGVVQESPDDLAAAAAGVLGFTPDPDTLALARMGRSEGVDGMEYRMHVALNDLAYLQGQYGTGVYSSVLALMIHSKVASADGHFSKQSLGKRYSTAHDPYAGDYALAQQVQSDHASGIDPTGGARQFIDKDGPLYVDGVLASYADFVAERATEGLAPTTLPNATDNFIVFQAA